MSNDRGWSDKREREYENLVDRFEEEGRYEGREEEVAARIVNKQRAEYGETQAAKEEDKEGRSPDRNLPIDDYDQLTVNEVTSQLDDLSPKGVRKVKEYEEEHKDRSTLVDRLDSETEK